MKMMTARDPAEIEAAPLSQSFVVRSNKSKTGIKTLADLAAEALAELRRSREKLRPRLRLQA